jgi:hypothetical protein
MNNANSNRNNFDISFLLATIIAGSAITLSIEKYFYLCSPNQIIVPCNLLSLGVIIITIIRFFHGNIAWQTVTFAHDEERRELSAYQKIVKFLSCYYIHIFQYILFVFAGQYINITRVYLIMLFGVSLLDIIWTFISWINESNDILKSAVGSWFVLNVITAIFCVVFIKIDISTTVVFLKYTVNAEIIIIFGFYLLMAIVDYIYNRRLFFGIE